MMYYWFFLQAMQIRLLKVYIKFSKPGRRAVISMWKENLVKVQMNTPDLTNEQMQFLLHQFLSNLKMDVSLARYSSARVGGRAKAFIEATSAKQLAEIITIIWSAAIP